MSAHSRTPYVHAQMAGPDAAMPAAVMPEPEVAVCCICQDANDGAYRVPLLPLLWLPSHQRRAHRMRGAYDETRPP